MKTKLLPILSFSLSLFLGSCSSDSDANPIEQTPTPDPMAKVTYNKDIKTLINNSCATSACHDATNPTGNLSLTNYTQVKAATESGKLLTRVNNNTMPPSSPLSTNNKQLLEKWKTDGYLEN